MFVESTIFVWEKADEISCNIHSLIYQDGGNERSTWKVLQVIGGLP